MAKGKKTVAAKTASTNTKTLRFTLTRGRYTLRAGTTTLALRV